ncbi:MAG: hypothetical protein ABRQ39_00695 [Candidatus Eremiobacterota bacterium]
MNILSRDIMIKLEIIREADIIVGITDLHEDTSVARVLKAVSFGLAKYFPDQKALIIKAGGKDDGVFSNLDLYEDRELNFIYTSFIPVHRLIMDQNMERGNFLKGLFYASDMLNASACMILRGDLRSINPEWIEGLLTPVIKGEYDYISPVYVIHHNDGVINNNLVYPLIRSLFCTDIRFPGAGDYAMSVDLVRSFLEKDLWNMDIDTWVATAAAGEGFETGQVFLGNKYIDKFDTIQDMRHKFIKTSETLFHLMKIYREVWANSEEEKYLTDFGYHYKISPSPVSLNRVEIKAEGEKLFHEYRSSIKKILSKDTFNRVEEASQGKESSFSADLWTEVIFEYASYVSIHGEEVMKSMVPMFFLRISSLIEDREISPDEVRNRLNSECNLFIKMKDSLIETYSSADRQ